MALFTNATQSAHRMTLRHRLLLLYGIIILLSLGTVGVALFELTRSRQVFGALQYWNDHSMVASGSPLRDGFPEELQRDPKSFAQKRFSPSIQNCRAPAMRTWTGP